MYHLYPDSLFPSQRELYIESFAGGGGAGTGAEQALGRDVDYAVNHDPRALCMYQANHPRTVCVPENVWKTRWVELTRGKPVGAFWASPDCKDHSKAKGGKPRSPRVRGLAWVIIDVAEQVRPRVIFMENVEEFEEWGPLLRTGKRDPERLGQTFRHFVSRLRRLGYVVEWRQIRARDYGAPTLRNRLYLIARCDGRPIIWPDATHGAPDSAVVISGQLAPWRSFAECADWSLPCPSIFTPGRDLVENTMKRIAKGVFRFVINNPNPFIIPGSETNVCGPVVRVDMHKSNAGCFYNVNDQLRTITGAGGFGIVTAFLSKYYGGEQDHGFTPHGPLHSITGIDHHAIVTSHLMKMRGTNIGQPINSPLHTVSAGGNHFAEVRAFLIKYYGTGNAGQRCDEPLHTITARDRLGLVTVHGEPWCISDIGMRMLTPRELFRAQGFPESYIIDPFFEGKRLSKEAQVRMCGNSVCPPVARALVAANVPDMCVPDEERCAA